jgi:hypothetical protein
MRCGVKLKDGTGYLPHTTIREIFAANTRVLSFCVGNPDEAHIGAVYRQGNLLISASIGKGMDTNRVAGLGILVGVFEGLEGFADTNLAYFGTGTERGEG